MEQSAWRETRRMNAGDVKLRLFGFSIAERKAGKEPLWFPPRVSGFDYSDGRRPKAIPESEAWERIARQEAEAKELAK